MGRLDAPLSVRALLPPEARFRGATREVLRALCEAHSAGIPLTLGELKRQADVSKSTAIRCVRELMAKGVVAREPDTDDRRRAILRLTLPFETMLAAHLDGRRRALGRRRSRPAERLREGDQRLRGIFHDSLIAAVLCGLEEGFPIRDANAAFRRLFGRPDWVMAGTPELDLIHPDDRGIAGAGRRRLVAGEAERWDGELRYRRPDGSYLWGLASVSLLRDRRGRPLCTLGQIQDIDVRKEAERALTLAKDEADFANRAKTAFVANLSHELRTPLNAIVGFAEVMASEMFGALGHARYRDIAADIRESGRHMIELLNDIIDISRIEMSGELPLDEKPLDLPSVVDSCRRIIGGHARKAGLELKIEMVAAMPALYADERRLRQILLNLLSNAIRSTPVGGAVSLTATTQDDDSIVFRVTDSGPGIRPEEFDNVMMPFGRRPGNFGRPEDGSGLGLPLVKSLAEQHGGTVRLESMLGVGTTVTVRFPRARTVRAV